ncbi:hypothetical protein HPB49_007497 [Dermacentor silvarum]|uniref:Uncharacterized protein n=1 Tax=Dermacentor silvarum TaxID=543639 RepID=A0ACB8CVY8_DERSI|nr:hypothetical protein HPB49_007497 [Dermacentor silvarum]
MRGLCQGCSLSPLLYILYVTSVKQKLLNCGLGFRLRYNMAGLAFADDLVLMAEGLQDLRALIDICHAKITCLELRFSCKETAIVHLAGPGTDEATIQLGDARVSTCPAYKYLGMQLSSDLDLYGQHETSLRQKALRAQCVLRRRILWGCNRYQMVRARQSARSLTAADYSVCLVNDGRGVLDYLSAHTMGERHIGGVGAPGTAASEV